MTLPVHHFNIGADGHVVGADGYNGGLAHAVHYAARMAAQLDSLLELGDLQRLRTEGASELDVEIGWGLGGECLVHARASRGAPAPLALPDTPVPAHLAPGQLSETIWQRARAGARSAELVDDAVRALHVACDSAWTMLLDSDLTPLRLFGSLDPRVVQVTASRCHGVIRGLGVRDVGALTLVYSHGSLVLFPSGTQIVAVHTQNTDLTALTTLIATARSAVLDPAAVLGPREPAPVVVESPDAELDAREDDFALPRYDFVPAGARFAGQLQQREPRTRRWGRSSGPSV